MPVKVFFSSVSGKQEIKKQQQKIFMILDSKKIEYTRVDISSDEDGKKEMRKLSDNPTALPPQISNGSTYCGDYDDFENAVEAEKLEEFLKV